MYRWILAVTMALFAFLAGGCATDLTFPSGSPIKSPYKVQQGIIVSFPDEIDERKFKVRVGGFIDQQNYNIPVGDVYKTETVARLSGVFTQGVTVTSRSIVDTLPPLRTSEEQEADPSTNPRLEAILEELRAKEKGEGKSKRTEAELMEAALRIASEESVSQKNSVYLLTFEDALFGFVDGRMSISYSMKFIDRRTGNVLHAARYSGRSRRFEGAQSSKTNENNLRDLARQAFSGAMLRMMDDIASSAGADISNQ